MVPCLLVHLKLGVIVGCVAVSQLFGLYPLASGGTHVATTRPCDSTQTFGDGIVCERYGGEYGYLGFDVTETMAHLRLEALQ